MFLVCVVESVIGYDANVLKKKVHSLGLIKWMWAGGWVFRVRVCVCVLDLGTVLKRAQNDSVT